jgi:lipopolysaccharide assembly protein B
VIQTDYSFLWMFFAAAMAVAAVALYKWRNDSRRLRPARDYYTDALNEIIAGKLRDAARSLTEAIRFDPDNIDAYLKLGVLLRQLGKPRRAAKIHLELSIRSDLTPPQEAAACRELATDLEQLNNIEKALNYLDRSRRLDSSNPEDLHVRLRIIEKQAHWKEAGEILKKIGSITGKPDPVKLALYKIEEGMMLCDEKREHDGRLLFKEAQKIDPNATEAKLFIASSYIREGRSDDAFEWLTTFIKELPERAQDALPLLESLLFDLGRFSEVESILKEALEKAPRNVNLALALIELAEKKGEIEEAAELCDRALEQSSDDVTLMLKRLALLKIRGRSDDVEIELEKLVDHLMPAGQGYFCGKCGFHSDGLRTRCPSCGEYRSFSGERRRIEHPLQIEPQKV